MLSREAFAAAALVAGRRRVTDDGIETFRDASGNRTVIVVDEDHRHGSRGDGDDRGTVMNGFFGEGAG